MFYSTFLEKLYCSVSRVMAVRYELLQSTTALWQKFGVPLLKFQNGSVVPLQQGSGDDLGLFYFVPLLARTFGLSLDNAIVVADFVLIAVSCAVAFLGFFLLATSILQRVIAAYGVLQIGFVVWLAGNVYIMPFFAFPWLIVLFVLLRNHFTKAMYVYLLLLGFIAGFSNSIRMYSAGSLVLATLAALFLYTKRWKPLLVAALVLASSYCMYSVWFHSLLQQPKDFFKDQTQQSVVDNYNPHHVFWHTIYAGLGFIPNSYGLAFDDTVIAHKIAEANPDIVYCSHQYDLAVKDHVLKIAKEDFSFVAKVMCAKVGVLLFYLLRYAWLGLLCAWFYRKPYYLEIPYLLALLFSALPGLLAIPAVEFVLGFITVANFYSIHSIIWALQQGLLIDLRHLFRRFFF